MACKCESDTAALCKSKGKDTFLNLSGTARQGNGRGAAWKRHAMCESAIRGGGRESSVSTSTNTLLCRIIEPFM